MDYDTTSQEPPEVGARLTAAQIFSVAYATGEDELKRSKAGLTLSGIAAGLGMGLTGLGAATILAAVGPDAPGAHILSALLYPVGFIVVVMGRALAHRTRIVTTSHRSAHPTSLLRLSGEPRGA